MSAFRYKSIREGSDFLKASTFLRRGLAVIQYVMDRSSSSFIRGFLQSLFRAVNSFSRKRTTAKRKRQWSSVSASKLLY